MSLIRGPELLRPDHACADFDCGKHALNEWVATHALSNQSKGFSRVIVMAEAGRVIAFYGLAPTSISARAMPRSVRTGRHPDPIPAILLGQFAVDRRYSGKGLGGMMLGDALKRAIAGADAIGGRAILVRAIDRDAEHYWESNGFIASKHDPSLLFRSVADVRTLFE